MRLLFWDIETAPLLAHVWSAKTDYVPHNAFVHDSFLLSWAAKWSDGKRVYGARLTGEEAVDQDDGRIVQAMADMLREADAVVAHNGDRFDIPMLNNRLLALGLQPLGNVKMIDTLTLARKSFRLASSKLDYLGEFLLGERKIKTDFDLWLRCYRGEESALREMYRYNRKDVVLLERIYDVMKPYVKGLPRQVDAEYEGQVKCPACGAGRDEMQKRGKYRTNASTFQKWWCKQCGRNSRSRIADKDYKLGLVPLP